MILLSVGGGWHGVRVRSADSRRRVTVGGRENRPSRGGIQFTTMRKRSTRDRFGSDTWLDDVRRRAPVSVGMTRNAEWRVVEAGVECDEDGMEVAQVRRLVTGWRRDWGHEELKSSSCMGGSRSVLSSTAHGCSWRIRLSTRSCRKPAVDERSRARPCEAPTSHSSALQAYGKRRSTQQMVRAHARGSRASWYQEVARRRRRSADELGIIPHRVRGVGRRRHGQ